MYADSGSQMMLLWKIGHKTEQKLILKEKCLKTVKLQKVF